MSRKHILGVDPGFKGALALYDPYNKACVAIKDMPLLNFLNQKRNTLDLFDLAQWIGLYASDVGLALVEKVSAMTYKDRHGEIRGQSASGAFEFGRSTGVVQGIIASFNIPTVLVHPASWKSAMGLTSNKQDSLDKAKTLFPTHRHYFLRKKDDGRAEALLMAVFASKYTRHL